MTIIDFIPPIIFNLKNKIFRKRKTPMILRNIKDQNKQDLAVYWDNNFADILENWGEENVWNEIQLLLANVDGKILDIACGTGTVIERLKKYKNLDLYGFDISDLLIERARNKGIQRDRLSVCDATKTSFPNIFFDYSYSIGSLEHFTIDGIDNFISESSRYTKFATFHMIPVSASGKDEGWITSTQSYFNNSEEWWSKIFSKHFPLIHIIKSTWSDGISNGRWFLCYKQNEVLNMHSYNLY